MATIAEAHQFVEQRKQRWQAVIADIAVKAKATLPACHERVDKAVEIVLGGGVAIMGDGHSAVQSQSDGEVEYFVVNGTCDCKDYEQAPSHWCKRRIAAGLQKRGEARMQHPTEAADPAEETPETPAEGAPPEEPLATPSTPDRMALTLAHIPRHYIVTIQDKPYIKYNGLVDLAQQHGLVELSTTVMTVTPDFAVCQCVARFADGRIFTDIGDATPENVKSHLKDHFIRIAATRATARALRRALNIDMVAVEELGEEERSATQRHRKAA
jgi:hypothetical protein